MTTESSALNLELPNIISLAAPYLSAWANVIFSILIAVAITVVAYFASKKSELVPGRLQNAAELLVGGLDSFVCGIIGPSGRRFTPFIGTLFIYILAMNLAGFVPFMKSSTSNLSTTLALAACVFLYVQYTSFRELGFLGYIDVLMGRPRGFMAFTAVFPMMMFFLNIVSELIRPVTLSLRLRSNIWGDDMLLAVLAGFGVKGVPLLVFTTLITIIAAFVQAVVFALLTTIYLAFIFVEKEEKEA